MCDLIDMEYDEKSGSYISKSNCEVMGDILVLDNTDSKDNEIIGLLREKAKKTSTTVVNPYGYLYDDIYYDCCGYPYEDGFWDSFADEKDQIKNYKTVKNDKKDKDKDAVLPIDDDEDDFSHDEKDIKFYRDINNPTEENIVHFNNVVDFSDYLEAEGIYICDNDINRLLMQSVIYCCVNPYDEGEHGEPILIMDNNLASLQWSCDAISECDFE